MINANLLKQILGKKYDPEADYVLEHSHLCVTRIHTGECKLVGEFQTESDGTMIILERNPKPEPSFTQRMFGIERKKK
jgi:hypothetical protein